MQASSALQLLVSDRAPGLGEAACGSSRFPTGCWIRPPLSIPGYPSGSLGPRDRLMETPKDLQKWVSKHQEQAVPGSPMRPCCPWAFSPSSASSREGTGDGEPPGPARPHFAWSAQLCHVLGQVNQELPSPEPAHSNHGAWRHSPAPASPILTARAPLSSAAQRAPGSCKKKSWSPIPSEGHSL